MGVLPADGQTLLSCTLRATRQDLTPEEFAARYEVPRAPVVITGLTDGWAAQREWTPQRLLAAFRDHRFKVRSV